MKTEIRIEQKILKPDRKKIRRLVSYLAKRYQASGNSLSVFITDNRGITNINERFLGHQGPTDVITFPGNSECFGDIAISAEQALNQAERWDGETEILFLLVHGFLHLMGFSDYNEKDRKKMLLEGELVLTDFLREYGE